MKRRRRSARDPRSNIRAALARVDRLLSQAEDVIGRELSSVDVRLEAPKTYDRADRAFTHIEKARRELSR